MTKGRPSVSLGMYDFPWTQDANDELWTALRDRLERLGLRYLPHALDRHRGLQAIWTDPELLVAQSCGYPLRTRLAGRVAVVATPVYDGPYCDGAQNRSAVIVRKDASATSLADLRGGVCAINGWDSNSGMNMLRAAVAPLAGGRPFFSRVVVTGAHLQSLAAVSGGEADVAAIDGVTVALAAEHRPGLLDRVKVIAATPASPGLPLVSSIDTPAETIILLRRALREVAADPALAETRRALLLKGFDVLPDAAYDRVLALETEAAALGYPRLE